MTSRGERCRIDQEGATDMSVTFAKGLDDHGGTKRSLMAASTPIDPPPSNPIDPVPPIPIDPQLPTPTDPPVPVPTDPPTPQPTDPPVI
jgi:hypothetical protein